MKRRRIFNPKRKIRPEPTTRGERAALATLASKARYGGNPEHKRNPLDYGLPQPNHPREGKTLCDKLGPVRLEQARQLLTEGMRRGLVSIQERKGWPQNVWAVHNGIPVEAMLENSETGTYHGYPLLTSDPLYTRVLQRWNLE